MDPILNISYQNIAEFLEAAEGNYRNAIYVTCSCNSKEEAGCRDFLFIPGHDCRPILFPRRDAALFLGVSIDPTDCAAQISGHAFLRLYSKWISLVLSSPAGCPVLQLLTFMNMNHSKNGKI